MVFILLENLTRNCKINELFRLIEFGLISHLVEYLKNEETYELINSGLDIFRNIFEAESFNENMNMNKMNKNLFLDQFLQNDGGKLLDRFQNLKNEIVHEKTINLIEDFLKNEM